MSSAGFDSEALPEAGRPPAPLSLVAPLARPGSARWHLSTTRAHQVTTEACWWAADDGGGGDFFEVAALAGGRVGMVIGDAPGSGARAARLGSRLGNGARGLLGAGTPAGALLEALDGIVQDAGVDLIATALCVVIDARAGKAELTSAGHLPGLRVALHGVGELLYPNRYPPLGITATRSASRYDFGWDDGMYLFTDGMVERHQISIDAGLGALTRASAGLSGAMASAPELARRTTQRLGRPQDDAMVVSLRLNARPALDRG